MNEVGLFDWQEEHFLNSTSKFNVLPAGRRTGKTNGAAICASIKTAMGEPTLWVDTIYSNIDRYYERYFLSFLKTTNWDYEWNVQKKILKIENSYIDFRSADKPESIEGFGYRNIFLNEAGIILKKEYLYTNAILPMLIDYEDSQLFAFGTPKGVISKSGGKHRFYKMWQNVIDKKENYSGVKLSSYDNPLNSKESIDELIEEIGKGGENVRQEIFADFVEDSEDVVFKSLNTYDTIRYDEVEMKVSCIDVADQGNDYLCQIVGYVVGNKIFIEDVIMDKSDTSITQPRVVSFIKQHKADFNWIEANNAGNTFTNYVVSDCPDSNILPFNSTGNKMTRILSNEWIITKHFYFKSDYEHGSDYDLFMRNLKSFNKDMKLNVNDDAPDCVASLARLLYGNFPHLFNDYE